MRRQVERSFAGIRRRFSMRQLEWVGTFLLIFLLTNIVMYLIVTYIIFPIQMSFTTETTTTTTTTTVTTTTTTEESTTLESTTEAPPEYACFFAQTNITLADGSWRSLSSLKVGDDVRVYTPAGKIQSSPVLTIFRHFRSSVRFLEITTSDPEKSLRLTPTHSLLIQKAGRPSAFDFASTIEIGDSLRLSDATSVRVLNIKELLLTNQTVSTPLTFEGTILANELIASCYGTFSHSWMHLLSAPLRYWYQLGTFSRLNEAIVQSIDFYARLSAVGYPF